MIKILITVLLIIQQFENKITILVHKKYMKDSSAMLDAGKIYSIVHHDKIEIITFEKESMLARNINLVKKADLVIGVSDLFLAKFAECNPAKVSSICPNKPYFVHIRDTRRFVKHDRFIPIGFCDISLVSDVDRDLKDINLSVFNPLLSTTGLYVIYFIKNNMSREIKNILLSKISDTIFFAPNWAEAFFKFFNHQHSAVVTCFMDQFNTLNDTIRANMTIPIKSTYLNRILNRKVLYIKNVFYKRPLYIEYTFANTETGLRFLLVLLHKEYMSKLQKMAYLEPATKLKFMKKAAVMNSEIFWKNRKQYIKDL